MESVKLTVDQQRLVEENTGLAYSVAYNYWKKIASHALGSFDIEDLKQCALMGVCKAAAKFDPSKGVKFSTYAYRAATQTIWREVHKHSRLIRIPEHVNPIDLPIGLTSPDSLDRRVAFGAESLAFHETLQVDDVAFERVKMGAPYGESALTMVEKIAITLNSFEYHRELVPVFGARILKSLLPYGYNHDYEVCDTCEQMDGKSQKGSGGKKFIAQVSKEIFDALSAVGATREVVEALLS